jgi:hypothetical protein
MECGGVGQTEGGESIGGLDDRAFVEMKIEIGAEGERKRTKDTLGDNEPAAARFPHRSDRLFEGFGIEELAVTDCGKVREDKRAIGDRGQRGFDVLGCGRIDDRQQGPHDHETGRDNKGDGERGWDRDTFHHCYFLRL